MSTANSVAYGALFALAAYYFIEDEWWKALHAVSFAAAILLGVLIAHGGLR